MNSEPGIRLPVEPNWGSRPGLSNLWKKSPSVRSQRHEIEEKLSSGVRDGQEFLLGIQNEKDGYWWAELEANSTINSEFIYLMHMLDRHDPELERKACNDIMRLQNEDGGWSIYQGGPSELSATVECYVALKMAGHNPEAPHMVKARERALAMGGVSKSRVFTRMHLALMGLYDYAGTPSVPAWFMLFPTWFPFNIYEMSSWARSCVVPIMMLWHYRPVMKPKRDIRIDELYVEGGPDKVDHRMKLDWSAPASWENFFLMIDRVLKLFEKVGFVPFAEKALEACERWILSRQDEEGDWGGIIPAMAYSLLALKARGYANNDPVTRNGWRALCRFGIETKDSFRLQSCVSPVWDTALSMWALRESGFKPDHPQLQKAVHWLISKELKAYGDWSVKNRKGRPGGWSFEFHNRYYPDCDDTAAVLMGMQTVRMESPQFEDDKQGTMNRAIGWLETMQCKDGGWGAFDMDNNRDLLNEIPFADLKAMLDPNTPDLTGRVVEMLGSFGRDLSDPVVRRAVVYLKKSQEKNGSWFGRWGVNYLYGTWAVLCGLESVGYNMKAEPVRRAVEFLKKAQHTSGGWGEDCSSYPKGEYVPNSPSASQTAWAVMGLIAAGEGHSPEAERGIQWLLDHQRSDGSWDEEEFTGTGFPGHFYIRYHLYRQVFPLMALGRYAQVIQGRYGRIQRMTQVFGTRAAA